MVGSPGHTMISCNFSAAVTLACFQFLCLGMLPLPQLFPVTLLFTTLNKPSLNYLSHKIPPLNIFIEPLSFLHTTHHRCSFVVLYVIKWLMSVNSMRTMTVSVLGLYCSKLINIIFHYKNFPIHIKSFESSN